VSVALMAAVLVEEVTEAALVVAGSMAVIGEAIAVGEAVLVAEDLGVPAAWRLGDLEEADSVVGSRQVECLPVDLAVAVSVVVALAGATGAADSVP
jgi:hypothetical protein